MTKYPIEVKIISEIPVARHPKEELKRILEATEEARESHSNLKISIEVRLR